MPPLLLLFIALRLAQLLAEQALAALNRRYWTDPARQDQAGRILRIPDDDMKKAVAYAEDRYRFDVVTVRTGPMGPSVEHLPDAWRP